MTDDEPAPDVEMLREVTRDRVTVDGDPIHYLSAGDGGPTLVHGADDGVIPLAWSERAADRLPDADLHVLEDCGHLSTWEQGEWVDEIVAGAL